jgi:hypothetical protein
MIHGGVLSLSNTVDNHNVHNWKGCGLKFREIGVRWGKRKKEAADEKGQSRRGMEKSE